MVHFSNRIDCSLTAGSVDWRATSSRCCRSLAGRIGFPGLTDWLTGVMPTIQSVVSLAGGWTIELNPARMSGMSLS